MNKELIKLAAAESREMPAGAPEEILLFPKGQISYADGLTTVVDDAALSRTLEKYKARGNDLVFDYEHQTDGGEYASPDGTAPAAGWIKDLYAKADGLWARVDWTDRAREFLNKREYRYFSPVWKQEKESGRLAEVLRVALTNAPKTLKMRPLVAKDEDNDTEDRSMLEKLIELLGLDAGASEEDVYAKIESLMKGGQDQAPEETQAAKDLETATQKAKDLETVTTELAKELGVDADKDKMLAKVSELKLGAKNSDEVTKRLAKLESEAAQKRTEELVAWAAKEGKVTPDMKDEAAKWAARDPEGFESYMAKQPAIIDPKKIAATAKDDRDEGYPEMTLQMANCMGLTKEDLVKFGPKAQAE